MADVIIVGAGLSGLIAAWQASQQGHRLRVLEQGDSPGGMMGTRFVPHASAAPTTHTGYWVETGPHTFPASASRVLSLCQQLNLIPQVLAAKNRYLAHTPTQLVKAPQGPWSGLTSPLLSAAAKCRLLAEPCMPAAQHEQTVAQFVSQRFGPEVANNLVAPLLTGIYAGDIDQLSASAVMPTLVDWAAQHGSILKGALQTRKNRKQTFHSPPPDDATRSTYPKGTILGLPGGMQTLVDALADRVPPGALHCNTPVLAVEPLTDNRWQVTTGASTLTCDQLVLAAPAHQASRLVMPWQPELGAALGGIPYSPVTVLHVGLNRRFVRHALDGFGFLVPPRLKLPILGCIFASTLFPSRAPDGHVLLTVMIGGSLRPELTALPDAALIPLVWQALTPLLGLGDLSQADMIHRIDWPQAIPQLTMGHRQRWQVIQQTSMPGLRVLGNFGRGIALEPLVTLAWPP
jgi:protoporphyrinogen/coproporphyrinogen III oxidase